MTPARSDNNHSAPTDNLHDYVIPNSGGNESRDGQGSDDTPKIGTHLMHRSLAQPPELVTSAQGLTLTLSSGQTILDACGGAAVAILGHGNEEVLDAMATQSRQVSYIHTQAYTTSSAELLASTILSGNPHNLEKAFFVSSGSEAVESALKLARQYHFEKGERERLHFVSRRQSYHGSTIGAMSVSANLGRKVPYGDGFGYPHVSYVSPAYAYRYAEPGEDEDAFTARLLGELEDEFIRVGPHRVAAFIAEPVVGACAGCVVPPRGYLSGVRAVCDKYDILLILDEVMCGTGRTGRYFAFSFDEARDGARVEPDIVTAGKGLGGGYAVLASVYIHSRVVDVLRRGSAAFNHGHTYQAHPVSCATALAVQRILKRDGLVERCAAMGHVLERELRAQLAGCESVGDIRGRGLFWAVEFVRDRASKATFDLVIGFGVRVQQEAFRRGVAVYPGSGTVDGIKGDHVLLAPPYTVTTEEIGVICEVLKETIQSQEALYLQ